MTSQWWKRGVEPCGNIFIAQRVLDDSGDAFRQEPLALKRVNDWLIPG